MYDLQLDYTVIVNHFGKLYFTKIISFLEINRIWQSYRVLTTLHFILEYSSNNLDSIDLIHQRYLTL